MTKNLKRLTKIVLLIAFLGMVSVGSVLAQGKITLSLKQATVKSILNELERF